MGVGQTQIFAWRGRTGQWSPTVSGRRYFRFWRFQRLDNRHFWKFFSFCQRLRGRSVKAWACNRQVRCLRSSPQNQEEFHWSGYRDIFWLWSITWKMEAVRVPQRFHRSITISPVTQRDAVISWSGIIFPQSYRGLLAVGSKIVRDDSWYFFMGSSHVDLWLSCSFGPFQDVYPPSLHSTFSKVWPALGHTLRCKRICRGSNFIPNSYSRRRRCGTSTYRLLVEKIFGACSEMGRV